MRLRGGAGNVFGGVHLKRDGGVHFFFKIFKKIFLQESYFKTFILKHKVRPTCKKIIFSDSLWYFLNIENKSVRFSIRSKSSIIKFLSISQFLSVYNKVFQIKNKANSVRYLKFV